MKKFIVAAALAVALGFGTSGKADAQIVYGYTVPNAGGLVSGGTIITPGATKTFNNFYSPFTGTTWGQSYTQNVFGQAAMRTYGYNGITGMGFRSGFVQPNIYGNPFGGFGYNNVYQRRWFW